MNASIRTENRSSYKTKVAVSKEALRLQESEMMLAAAFKRIDTLQKELNSNNIVLPRPAPELVIRAFKSRCYALEKKNAIMLRAVAAWKIQTAWLRYRVRRSEKLYAHAVVDIIRIDKKFFEADRDKAASRLCIAFLRKKFERSKIAASA